MKQCNVIAIDLAKNVFQVCGFSKSNKVLFNKSLKRSQLAQFMANKPPTQVAMEACYTNPRKFYEITAHFLVQSETILSLSILN